MLLNYLKTSLRALCKHKAYTSINLFGLVTGLSSALVLVLFAHQQLSFDGVHVKRGQIHLVYKERTTPNGTQIVYDTWVPTLDALRESYPEIEDGTRNLLLPGFLSIDAKKFQEQVTFADPSFFTLFSLSTEEGDGFRQLQDRSSIILSPETAMKFFGTEEAIGKPVQMQLGGVQFDFTVSGVLNDIPVNSSIRPSVIVPFENALSLDFVKQAEWGSSFLETYVLLNNPGQAAKLESMFPEIVKKVFDEETASRMRFRLLPLAEYYNQRTNSDRLAYIMLCIAGVILVVAVINYINLATVRSVERSKEIGLRKVLGATRFALTRQFLGESFILTTLSFSGALILLQLAMPFINSALGISLNLRMMYEPELIILEVILPAHRIFVGKFPGALYRLVKAGRIHERQTEKLFLWRPF